LVSGDHKPGRSSRWLGSTPSGRLGTPDSPTAGCTAQRLLAPAFGVSVQPAGHAEHPLLGFLDVLWSEGAVRQ
jgi:hypothetical protein